MDYYESNLFLQAFVIKLEQETALFVTYLQHKIFCDKLFKIFSKHII